MADNRTGIERIADERRRQVEVEGLTPENDDKQDGGQLAAAAACYAAPGRIYQRVEQTDSVTFIDPWPTWWAHRWDKRRRDTAGVLVDGRSLPVEMRIRNLEKAGALIAAEIDRLLRREGGPNG